MKTIISFLLLSCCLSVRSAPIAPNPTLTNTAWLVFNMVITNTTGGLSTNDFSTNYAAVFKTAPDVTTPDAQWNTFQQTPVTFFLQQGPVGTIWTNQIGTDGATRFFKVAYTNISNGGIGPFSQPYPLIWDSALGQLGARKQ